MDADREQQLNEAIDRQARYIVRLQAEVRRVHEELDWRDEKIRVLTRVIERLGLGQQ